MLLGIYFLLVVRFIGILWFIVICHIYWYFCGISCNLTFFISDFMWLVFFLMYLSKGYKFCFFWRTNSFFHYLFFFQSLFHSFPLLSLWFLLTFVVPSLSHVRLCSPMDCNMPGFLVLHNLLEFAQTSNFSFCFFLYSSSFRYKVGWLVWKFSSFLK